MDSSMPPAPEGALVLWIIYDHPRDFPDVFVLRRDFVLDGGRLVNDQFRRFAARIEDLRALLPPDVMLYPIPDPDPVIAEVWI